MELETTTILKSAFFLPAGPSVSDRIVMDIGRAGHAYPPANDKMFGSLNTQNPSVTKSPVTTSAGIPAGAQKKPANFGAKTEPTPPATSRKTPKPVIVIDPGHGGQDPGAIGAGGRREKDITLATSLELSRQLEATGRYRVHLTRSTDKFIKLQDRVAIGRKHGADLFISLHADSIDKPTVRGASIYTLSNKASDAQTAKLAARENQADLIAGVDLSHEDKEVANILIDLAMRDTMNQSKFFANTVVSHVQRNDIRLLEQPHRFAGFAVLKAPDVPSVLIEIGFMSNKSEVDQLSSPAYRQKIARSIASGIDAYFAKVQKNAD